MTERQIELYVNQQFDELDRLLKEHVIDEHQHRILGYDIDLVANGLYADADAVLVD